jgi:hypothetical protein
MQYLEIPFLSRRIDLHNACAMPGSLFILTVIGEHLNTACGQSAEYFIDKIGSLCVVINAFENVHFQVTDNTRQAMYA